MHQCSGLVFQTRYTHGSPAIDCDQLHNFMRNSQSDFTRKHMPFLYCLSDMSRTSIAMRGKDGVVFGVEKLVTSKLHESQSNKRIFTADHHIGMVIPFPSVTSFYLALLSCAGDIGADS